MNTLSSLISQLLLLSFAFVLPLHLSPSFSSSPPQTPNFSENEEVYQTFSTNPSPTPRPTNNIYTFLFLTPPASFLHQMITVALELASRGHKVYMASGEGGEKHFKGQLESFYEVRRQNLEQTPKQEGGSREDDLNKAKELDITFLNLSGGIDFTRAMEAILSGDKANEPRIAMSIYNKGYEDIIIKLKELNNTISVSPDTASPKYPNLFSPDLVIITNPLKAPALFCGQYNYPFVLILTTPAAVSNMNPSLYVPIRVGKNVPLFHKSMLQRLKLIIKTLRLHILGFPIPSLAPDMYKHVLKIYPTIPSFGIPQALTPLSVFTGPISSPSRSSQPLPFAVSQMLSESDLPVVYISLGSHSPLSPAHLELIINASVPRSGKWRVVWALSDTYASQIPPTASRILNAYLKDYLIVNWVETPALLAHPKVKLFISHFGGNGLNEAVDSGKPVLGLPLFADQPANCRAAEEVIGLTTCLDIYRISETDLRRGIEKFVYTNDPSNINGQRNQNIAERESVETLADDNSYVNKKQQTIRERSQNLKRLVDTYGGLKKTADWLEIAALYQGNFSLLESAIEREGVIKAFGIDILGFCFVALFIFGLLVGVTIGKARKSGKKGWEGKSKQKLG